jgi:hypothetical protein
MNISEAWEFFKNHLINEMVLDDDDDAKEAYSVVSDFIESKIKEEENVIEKS